MPVLGPGDAAVIGLHIHQDDIRADLSDAAPGNAEVVFLTPEAQIAAGSGDDDRYDPSFRDFHLHV